MPESFIGYYLTDDDTDSVAQVIFCEKNRAVSIQVWPGALVDLTPSKRRNVMAKTGKDVDTGAKARWWARKQFYKRIEILPPEHPNCRCTMFSTAIIKDRKIL
jgi:hypothetical protein